MKIAPETKLDKRNKTTSKKFGDDLISASCGAIVIFTIYGWFGAIWKPDSKCIVCKSYSFINSNLLSYILEKVEAELKNLLHSSCTIGLSKGSIFAKKCWFFGKKMLTSASLRGAWYWKTYLLKLYKFQVSSMVNYPNGKLL